jgi:5-methylcytosine-specific restriction enzyme B
LTDTHNPHATFRLAPDRFVSDFGLDGIHREFNAQTIKAGLCFGDESEHALFTAVFLASLATKPFVILSGLSGSGKTLLATTFGEWLGPEQVLVQPVRPDWYSPEALLGFEDRTSGGWNVPRTLEFILKASRDPSRPYLLVLEEMNLAHVERYFADVLSGMESGQPMVPNLVNNATGWHMPAGVDEYVVWPKNIFLVGSINVDETTYEFSPKVLDRASVREFRVAPGALLIKYPPRGQIERASSQIASAFLERSLGDEAAWVGHKQVGAAMQKVHETFYQYAAEFGHRVFRESLRFGSMLNEIGVTDLSLILDLIMVQRVIPKFDTERGFDQDLLLAIAGFAAFGPEAAIPVDPLDAPNTNVVLPRTLEKLRRIAIANAHTR